MNESSKSPAASPLGRLWPPLLVCVVLWVVALACERVTGAPLTEKLTALSDPSLLIILAAAVCFATGINFAFNVDWSVRAFETVFNMALDAFMLVWAATACAAIRFAFSGYNKFAIVVLAAPIALVIVWYVWRWIVTDLFKTIGNRYVRATFGVLIAFLGSAFLLYMI
ncbi:hypothetical protein [Rhizobium sp. 768_B6_N1_8]|uniref:hypothetical protein n=1 Tax=unclassified Rhizobium TaxID=2613769 RepID=UPI003F21CE4E